MNDLDSINEQRRNKILDKIKTCNGEKLDLSEMSMTDEDLQAVLPEIQKLTNLEELNLEENKLTNIDANAFQGLTNLKDLDLGSNKLTSIDNKTFKGLTNLKVLKLGSNKLTSIDNKTFKGLTNLKVLNLGSNKLTSISPDTFKELTNLEVLYLWSNKLTSISPDTFKELTNLEELDLHRNDLTTLPQEFFNNIRQECNVDLENNPLNPETRGIINGLGRSNISYDMAAFERENQNIQPLLAQLSPEFQQRYKEFCEDKYNVTTDDVPKEYTLGNFLEKVMLTSAYKDKTQKNKIVLPALEEMLSGSDEEIKNKISLAMQALGNCATPVNQFLIQSYIGLKAKNGEKIEDSISEKAAVGEFISTKLKNEMKGYGGDIAEKHEMLLDHLFKEGNTHIADKKNTSPSASMYYYTINKKHDLFQKFAKLVCQTDKDGNLIVSSDDKYIRDDVKVYVIKKKFLTSCGYIDEDTKPVNECVAKLKDLYEKKDNAKIKTLLDEYYCTTTTTEQNKKIEKLIDYDIFKHDIVSKFATMQNASTADKAQLAEDLFQERVRGLEDIYDELHQRETADIYDVQQRETAVNKLIELQGANDAEKRATQVKLDYLITNLNTFDKQNKQEISKLLDMEKFEHESKPENQNTILKGIFSFLSPNKTPQQLADERVKKLETLYDKITRNDTASKYRVSLT